MNNFIYWFFIIVSIPALFVGISRQDGIGIILAIGCFVFNYKNLPKK